MLYTNIKTVGIATGFVNGCILGKTGLRFHLFGYALERAIFLEQNCMSGKILIDEKSMDKYKDDALTFQKHENIENAYWSQEQEI